MENTTLPDTLSDIPTAAENGLRDMDCDDIVNILNSRQWRRDSFVLIASINDAWIVKKKSA